MRIALHAFNDNPGSPALVFGDALGTRTPLWAAVASRLVDDHQIYLSDLPGHTYPVSKEELSRDFTISDLAAGLVTSLEDKGVEVHVRETAAAIELYNELGRDQAVGGLFHSTC